MARTFFRMVLRKFSEITNTKPFLVSTIFFTSMNISFFNLRFNLFSIIAKKVNQIRNNVVCVVAHLVFVLSLCTHYGPLQCFSTYFRKLKEIGVLRPIFPDYVISCDYGSIQTLQYSRRNIMGGKVSILRHFLKKYFQIILNIIEVKWKVKFVSSKISKVFHPQNTVLKAIKVLQHF